MTFCQSFNLSHPYSRKPLISIAFVANKPSKLKLETLKPEDLKEIISTRNMRIYKKKEVQRTSGMVLQTINQKSSDFFHNARWFLFSSCPMWLWISHWKGKRIILFDTILVFDWLLRDSNFSCRSHQPEYYCVSHKIIMSLKNHQNKKKKKKNIHSYSFIYANSLLPLLNRSPKKRSFRPS